MTPPTARTTHPTPTTGGEIIQADLYFPSADDFGQWRILCSGALLSEMTRDSALFKAVLGRLRWVIVTLSLVA
jgi:hypothetical protein